MGLQDNIASGATYIAQANRCLGKQRYLLDRSRNQQTIATVQGLVEVLSALLVNVERQQSRRRAKGDNRRT
jgi:hypothetical protein